MRSLRNSLIGFAVAPALLLSQTGLAVIIDADTPLAADTRMELVRELGELLAPAGVRVDVQDSAPVNWLGTSVAVAYVTLHGVCPVEVARFSMPALGALGWVARIDGVVQPFIHVDAGAAAAHIGPLFVRGQEALARMLLGRALARVIMHELLHWLTQSAEHGEGPLFQPAVSASTLIAAGVGLVESEVWMVRRGLGLL